jgi:DNA-binding transcriptional LysR family regulator
MTATLKMRTGRKIPPLNPLHAFEVAARHLSFTDAAEELCVTQGAISRSVKALEDYLGEPLFERTGHGLMLTERGQAFSVRLTEGFTQLAQAADEFGGRHSPRILTVRTYTSFLIGFLIQHLPDFQVRHPDIKVHLVSATDTAEFTREQVDVRIRYGRGHWKDVESTLLFRDTVRPVCSPNLLDPSKRPYPIDILREQVLLHQELRKPDWGHWLGMAGAAEIEPRDNIVFDELSIAYQAAIAGLGLVMAQEAYFRREIAEGKLFAPFDEVLTRDCGYYLTVPMIRRDCPHVRAFSRWLLQMIEEGRARAAQAGANLKRTPLVSTPSIATPAASRRDKLVA